MSFFQQPTRCLVPEVDPIIHPENSNGSLTSRCPKADTHHPHFIAFPDLDLHHLPERWRQEHVLHDIRDISRRVVKLRVRKSSPDRFAKRVAGPWEEKVGDVSGSCHVMSCHVMSGHVWSGQVKSIQVKANQLMSVHVQARLNQVRSGQVRSSQCKSS